MRIEYSDNAREVVKLRNISQDELEYCFLHPKALYSNKQDNQMIYKSTVNGRTIKVKIQSRHSPIFIITAYETGQD